MAPSLYSEDDTPLLMRGTADIWDRTSLHEEQTAAGMHLSLAAFPPEPFNPNNVITAFKAFQRKIIIYILEPHVVTCLKMHLRPIAVLLVCV